MSAGGAGAGFTVSTGEAALSRLLSSIIIVACSGAAMLCYRAPSHRSLLWMMLSAQGGGFAVGILAVFSCPSSTARELSYFLREMAPPGRGCVVWTFGLVSAPSYPRHLSRSPPRAPATHANSGAAGLRPPPLFSTINPRLNFHAIRSAVRLPRASQPLLLPVGRDAVGPSSVPHGVKAKCSGSWSG